MIDKQTFHPLEYIKKEEYSGSMDGMRYMLGRVSGEGEDAPDRIRVCVWPEPLGIQATPDEKKITEYFTLDTDGVNDAADWINKMFFDHEDEWKAALDAGFLI